jgi:hypothetical protein
VAFWDIMIALLNMGGDVLPINADRVSFTYDLPYFPYGREHPLKTTHKTGPPFWGADQDPLGPYPLFTAKGDFVTIAEAFDQDGGQEFIDIMVQNGLIQTVPLQMVGTAFIALLIFILSLGGGG